MRISAVILLVSLVALVSAGPNPYGRRPAEARNLNRELESVLEQGSASKWTWQSKAEVAAEMANAKEVKAQQSQQNGTLGELRHFMPGNLIYIYGKAPASGSFNIDLIPSYYGAYATDVIALRLTVNVDQYHVTRNSYAHEKWLYEENEGYSGIQPRRYFSIIIVVQTYSYEIMINGYHFATYYHRVPYTKDMRIDIDQSVHSDPIEYY